MKGNRAFYHVISDPVMSSKVLNDKSKLIYGLITGLTKENGFCWANNHYFAEFFEVSKETISRCISKLEKEGFIEIFIDEKNGNSRKIFVSENPFLAKEKAKAGHDKNNKGHDKNIKGSYQKHQEVLTKTSRGLDENVKHNNTINNTINNTNERETRALDFLKLNFPARFETEFLMRFSKTILDKKKFAEDFNDTVDTEELNYTDKILFARLGRYARNWVQNQNKYAPAEPEQKPAYLRKIS
ncbi:MAG TPA: helix-turn-helix domain-containing protein [Salinimicrobium sp.]|nr:helix-turn-helix domain-containing protein [Salinimicrobium sp.]